MNQWFRFEFSLYTFRDVTFVIRIISHIREWTQMVGEFVPEIVSLGASFAEIFQVFDVACDQRFFLYMGPALELPLPCQSLIFRAKRFRIDHTSREVFECIRSARPSLWDFTRPSKFCDEPT